MLLKNATIATMNGTEDYGLLSRGCISVQEGKITWVGVVDDLSREFWEDAEDLEGRLITPGLIDCHTHVVFGGHRASEFEMRLNGSSYEDIANAGGGIVSTVNATRKTGADHLLQDALTRVDAMISEGVTSLEVKSGYGLDIETELKMLRVAREIGQKRDVSVLTTFLGAHAVPKEYRDDRATYIQEICIPTLKSAHEERLVDAVDAFCEGIAFSSAEIEPVFDTAKALGLPIKIHAEQLSHCGGVQLATRYGALSADHVEYATLDDAKAMAEAGTTAVLLPGAFYTLHETRKPPVNDFRACGVPMALATDCNPGSSPLTSLLLTMNMGCTLFGLTPQEALAGVTCYAAKALGLEDRGVITKGMVADLAVWDVEHPAELSYRIGFNPLHRRIFGGAG